MEKIIPEISFLQTSKTLAGFDILTLNQLFSKGRNFGFSLDKPHRVTFFHIMFITLGTGIHYIDFQPFPYSKNTLLFISKGQVHSFEIRSDTDGFLILFTEEFLLRNLGQLDQHFIYWTFDIVNRTQL